MRTGDQGARVRLSSQASSASSGMNDFYLFILYIYKLGAEVMVES